MDRIFFLNFSLLAQKSMKVKNLGSEIKHMANTGASDPVFTATFSSTKTNFVTTFYIFQAKHVWKAFVSHINSIQKSFD